MIEYNGAIHHELHKRDWRLIDRTSGIPTRLERDQSGQLSCQQPFVDAINFALAGRLMSQQRKHDMECVEHDALTTHGTCLRIECREEPDEI